VGVILTIAALACATSAVRVDRPAELGFMYAWFGCIAFFGAWAHQTQARA
jgi:hypothetical protein